jgi:hypothetical protein
VEGGDRMNRRDFIGIAVAATTLPIPVSASNDATFLKSGDRFVRALAETILPGIAADETVRLLQAFLDEPSASRFQTGLRRLETRLTSRFSAHSQKERSARLQKLLQSRLPEDAAFAYEVVRSVALIELYSRQAGRELLATPFRTAP